MVATTPVVGTAYYQRIIDGLCDGIEALDATDYQWHTSERWTRSRYVDPDRGGTSGLSFWVSLGPPTLVERARIVYDAQIAFLARYNPDDDTISQSRMHAAARHLMEYLLAHRSDDARVLRIDDSTIEALTESANWLLVSLTFSLHVPRGA